MNHFVSINVAVILLALFDNGKAQSTVSPCVDLVIAFDVSCSLADGERETALTLVQQLVNNLGVPTNQIALFTYDKYIYHKMYLNDFKMKILYLSALGNVNTQAKKCRTKTWKALRTARLNYFTVENGDRPNVKNVLLLFTDGISYPKYKYSKTVLEVQRLKSSLSGSQSSDSPTDIYVIGLKNKYGHNGEKEWETIATDPFYVYPLTDVGMIVQNLKSDFEQYTCEL
ncbi:unnamed protein product [Owenia fusiformis]|uniref:VWFA domain-containing protein n=1 Tax=Owenia fusiformis TaxID=6347 RepID=A0A8S4PTP0_OWEFU|nr:unnamed protein product [Owenia fusiformis]